MPKSRSSPKRASSHTLTSKPTKVLVVHVREMAGVEQLALGLRTDMVTCEDGGVYSGAGMGSPWTILEWKGRCVAIHAQELLADWVRTFSPEDAARIEGANVTGAIGVQASQG